MRHAAILLIAAIVVVALAGCSLNASAPSVTDNNAFQPLTTTPTGEQVSLNVRSLKVADNQLSAEIRYTFANPGDKGLKYSIWKIQFRPSERLVRVLAITGYDGKGQKISEASTEEKPDVAEAPGYAFWGYIPPGGIFDAEAQALTEYCVAQKLSINTKPVPYIPAQYQFAGGYTSVLLFFDPASVKTEGDAVFFTAQVVYDKETPTGTRYEVGSMEIRPLENKFRGISRTAYNSAGQQVAQDTGTDGWSTLQAGSMIERLLTQVHEYGHEHNIPMPE